MSSKLCPKLDSCCTPVNREQFLSICVENYKDCPIIALKPPRKWLEELREMSSVSPTPLPPSRP